MAIIQLYVDQKNKNEFNGAKCYKVRLEDLGHTVIFRDPLSGMMTPALRIDKNLYKGKLEVGCFVIRAVKHRREEIEDEESFAFEEE